MRKILAFCFAITLSVNVSAQLTVKFDPDSQPPYWYGQSVVFNYEYYLDTNPEVKTLLSSHYPYRERHTQENPTKKVKPIYK